MILFVLAVGIAIWGFSRQRTTTYPARPDRPQMAKYFCDSCQREWIMPFSVGAVPCPHCAPLFQELDSSIDWKV